MTANQSNGSCFSTECQEAGTNKYLKIRWGYLGLCSLGLLSVGIIYGWSILNVPFQEEFSWSVSQLSLGYTISMSSYILGSLLDGFLIRRVKTRHLLRISAAMILCGFTGVSFLKPGGSITLLYLTYGILGCGGIGMAYNALISLGNDWFPDRRGLSTGIMMMFFGFSTMIFGTVISKMFEIPGIGWRKTYLLAGICIFSILFICSLILRHPLNKRHPEQNVVLPKAPVSGRHHEEFETRDYMAREMICRPTFWIYYIQGFLAAAIGSVVIGFARNLAVTLGANTDFAVSLVGALSFCNGLSRVLFGIFMDRLGRKKTMVLSAVITILAPALLLCALKTDNLLCGIAALCAAGVSFGSCPIISSTLVSSFYGMADYAMNYSISNTKQLLSSFMANMVGLMVAATGSFVLPAETLLVMSIVSLGLTFLIRHP